MYSIRRVFCPRPTCLHLIKGTLLTYLPSRECLRRVDLHDAIFGSTGCTSRPVNIRPLSSCSFVFSRIYLFKHQRQRTIKFRVVSKEGLPAHFFHTMPSTYMIRLEHANLNI